MTVDGDTAHGHKHGALPGLTGVGREQGNLFVYGTCDGENG